MNSPYYLVLDIETLRSAQDCLYCSMPLDTWPGGPCVDEHGHQTIGWSNKAALGLSIGCAWDSLTSRTSFFDEQNLVDTMERWVDEQPLIVTFNGISFDLPLLRGLIRRRAEALWNKAQNHDDYDERLAWKNTSAALTALCDAFKLLCATSYDILAAVWAASPKSKRVKGLNSLGALAEANGYGGKTGHGAETPRLWAAGKCAEVINYCASDVDLTKSLFEQIQRGEPLRRHDGSPLLLPKAQVVP